MAGSGMRANALRRMNLKHYNHHDERNAIPMRLSRGFIPTLKEHLPRRRSSRIG